MPPPKNQIILFNNSEKYLCLHLADKNKSTPDPESLVSGQRDKKENTEPKTIAERYQARLEEQEDKVTLSEEGMQRLRGETATAEKEDEDDNLPPHIKSLKQHAEKLKEDIEELQEELEKLQQQSNVTAEEMEALMQQLSMMQSMFLNVKQSLMEAMKEAGISDPSIMADL